MRSGVRSRLRILGCAALCTALNTGLAFAGSSTSCDDANQPWTFQRQPDDVSSATLLDVQRPVAELHSLEAHVCSGELRIVAAPHGSSLRLTVSVRGGGKPPNGYLQTFSTVDGHAVVTLQTPREAHAVVTLHVPAQSVDATTEVDLGAGTLRLEEHALRGDRKLNLGAGSAFLVLQGDQDYSQMQANVGMGRLVDSRPGGHDRFFVVSRAMPGKGAGLIEVNVGAGSIHLEPAPRH